MEERRKDYLNLSVYVERWDNFMNITEDYRQCLNGKIDKITTEVSTLKDKLVTLDKSVNEKILELPCKERKSWYLSISRQVAFMWVVLSVYILALFGLMIRVFAR